jgi:hypothetical protein
MCRGLAAALLGALLALPAHAQTIRGVVRAAEPLGDVSIVVEVNGRPLTRVSTDAAGRFGFSLAPGTGSASDVLMSFLKTGFAPATRLVSARDAAARPLEIELLPRTGQGAISEEVRRILEPAVTRVGTGPLMFVPYRLPADATLGTASDLNERLRLQLQRLILTHVQLSMADADTRDIALAQINVEAADLERLRTYGEFINALAVVSGLGIADGGTQTIELASSFVIIPRAPQFEPPVLTIVDTVPAASIGRVALDQRMSKEWGRATVIALAVRDLKDAQALSGAQKRDVLQKTERFLVAELSDVGANDQLSARKLQQLLEQVRRELSQ